MRGLKRKFSAVFFGRGSSDKTGSDATTEAPERPIGQCEEKPEASKSGWPVEGGSIPEWKDLPEGPLLRIFELLAHGADGHRWVSTKRGAVFTLGAWERQAHRL